MSNARATQVKRIAGLVQHGHVHPVVLYCHNLQSISCVMHEVLNCSYCVNAQRSLVHNLLKHRVLKCQDNCESSHSTLSIC